MIEKITKEILSNIINERVDSFLIKGNKIFVGNSVMTCELDLNEILILMQKDNK